MVFTGVEWVSLYEHATYSCSYNDQVSKVIGMTTPPASNQHLITDPYRHEEQVNFAKW